MVCRTGEPEEPDFPEEPDDPQEPEKLGSPWTSKLFEITISIGKFVTKVRRNGSHGC
jgi:hypothetical protein